MPTLNEIVNDLNSAELISKHDLTSGYHYLELDEDSRYITTFSTHVRFYHIQKAEFQLTKSLENVSAYGKTYRTARTSKNEPPFEQTLGTI